MESIRKQIIKRFPPPSRAIEPDDQLGHALYFMLRRLLDVAFIVDGWTLFKVIRESGDSLGTVGIMATLSPGYAVPMALSIKAADGGLVWSAQAAVDDHTWRSLSESKQWNEVYLYASGNRDETPWTWDCSYQGVCA